MKIVHNDDFNDSFFTEYHDESYFRLIHYLNNIDNKIVNGFSVKTADVTDIHLIVEIINKSYTDLSVNYDQIISYTKTPVYDENLWILVYESKTNHVVGCGIADFDSEVKEGILEWIQVLPEYRGRKLGQLIVKQLLCRMNKANFATVSGKVDNLTNPERVYRKCGFVGNDIWHVMHKKY
ncbi:MAG: GNAT family N-acetyltransferase [Eubacterium sp.]|nr:GNAT family N-acetyltransferase [Eubacterium sp.]